MYYFPPRWQPGKCCYGNGPVNYFRAKPLCNERKYLDKATDALYLRYDSTFTVNPYLRYDSTFAVGIPTVKVDPNMV